MVFWPPFKQQQFNRQSNAQIDNSQKEMRGFSKNEVFKMDRKCNMSDHRSGTIRSRF